YSEYEASSSAWSTPRRMGPGVSPRIATGASREVMLSWVDNVSGLLYYSRYDPGNSTWSESAPVGAEQQFRAVEWLSIDDDGNAYLVAEAESTELRVLRFDAGLEDWLNSRLLPESIVPLRRYAFASEAGIFAVAGRDEETNLIRVYHYDTRLHEVEASTILGTSGSIGDIYLAASANGHFAAVYGSGDELEFRRYLPDTESWREVQTVPGDGTGIETVIVDREGSPSFVYSAFGDIEEVYVVRYDMNASAWSESVEICSSNVC